MPTNEERREVAARLRNYADLRESFTESPICGFINALGFSGYLDWDGVCNRLADLVEPEERTCKYIWDADRHVWFCSECGGLEPCSDSVNYCCDCGTRVIGNIDERER